MKIKQASILLSPLLLNLLFLHPVSAANEKKVCIGAYNYAHCAYISGLDYSDARYIKFHNPQNHFSHTRCMNGADYYYWSQDAAAYYTGSRTISYYICSDELGTQCEPVGSDNFTIFKSWFSYSSEPKTYPIDLSVVKDQYPSCKDDLKTINYSTTSLSDIEIGHDLPHSTAIEP